MVATVIDRVCVCLDPEAVWEESKVPVWRDELGSARHSSAHSPTSKETMKDGGRKRRREREGREVIVSRWLVTTQKKSKQHLAEEKTDENNYFKRHTQTCLIFFFLFFFSYLPLNCCHSSSSSVLLFLCICVTFLKTCSTKNEKTQRCHSVAYQSVFFFLSLRPLTYFLDNRMTTSLVYHISLLPCLYRRNRY